MRQYLGTLFLSRAKLVLAHSQIFLNKERQAVPLKEKIQLSHDTFLYRFALPQKNSVLGLPVGKHFKIFSPNAVGSIKGQWNGQPVRSYFMAVREFPSITYGYSLISSYG